MMLEQTIEKLNAMRLTGMAASVAQWRDSSQLSQLSGLEALSLAVDAECTHRENKKMQSRVRQARFKEMACIEDIDYRTPRGLEKALMLELITSRWAQKHQNIILTGPTGIGKSYIAQALSHKACRDGYSVLYRRVPRLFDELAQARADGTHTTLMTRFAKANVLVLDDFGTHPLATSDRKELLELLEDRYNSSATVVTSQIESTQWHAVIGDPTIADSICDRLVHNAYKIRLSGTSERKSRAEVLTPGAITAK